MRGEYAVSDTDVGIEPIGIRGIGAAGAVGVRSDPDALDMRRPGASIDRGARRVSPTQLCPARSMLL
jgi:hypothetical protein